jgi:hypothetical protein
MCESDHVVNRKALGTFEDTIPSPVGGTEGHYENIAQHSFRADTQTHYFQNTSLLQLLTSVVEW